MAASTTASPPDPMHPPAPRLTGLPPVVDARTRLLVLGSFPGAASLAAGQYYAHPQNAFWKIIAATWLGGDALALRHASYAERLDCLLRHGLGLWDVYDSCEREGSLDAAIRQPQPNDLLRLREACPNLQAVGHNGGESYRHARYSARLGVPVHRLPSTSPANASWRFERKLAAWQDVFRLHGLI
ncbi:MAG: DNA-deoxyinosine glycosylase [Comamonas sp.]